MATPTVQVTTTSLLDRFKYFCFTPRHTLLTTSQEILLKHYGDHVSLLPKTLQGLPLWLSQSLGLYNGIEGLLLHDPRKALELIASRSPLQSF